MSKAGPRGAPARGERAKNQIGDDSFLIIESGVLSKFASSFSYAVSWT